jgi:hypothetical protein
MGLYSISLSTELAFYGPSASQVLPCMRCIFPLLYFTVYEGYNVLYILTVCTHMQWYYTARIYPSIQLIRGKGHISNQPGIYCYILGTKSAHIYAYLFIYLFTYLH